jgi:hypothetical protein
VQRADERDRIPASVATQMILGAAELMRRVVGDDAKRVEVTAEITERRYIGIDLADI